MIAPGSAARLGTPGSKKILCQYWFDNYLLTNYWDLGFQYQVNIEPISR